MIDPGSGRYIGQSVRRREDRRLVTGHGRYVADVVWPGTQHVAFLRSPMARGTIAALDVSAAQELPGVYAVLTGADLNEHARSWWHNMIGPDAPLPPKRLLARGDVRYVGEPIAMVLASSRYVAEDAVESIELELDPMDAILVRDNGYEAVAADTALVHHERDTNIAEQLSDPVQPGCGLDEAAIDRILASAARVITQTFTQHRYLCVPMETRGISVRWDPDRQLMDIVCATQSPHEVRSCAARMVGIREAQVQVSSDDVGGGFGQKMFPSTEELAVVMAAYRLGGAVQWIEDRHENLVAGGHARTGDLTLTMGTDEGGKIVALKAHYRVDVGAFPAYGMATSAAPMRAQLPGPYDIQNYYFSSLAVFSNTCGRIAYRGPSMMETVAREQMIDVVAAGLGLDPVEFRRINLIRSDQLPYTTATGMTYETVTPIQTLEQAIEMIGYTAFRAEQAAARSEGRVIGIGVSTCIEGASGWGVMGADQVDVRIDIDGGVVASTGSGSHGQSIETTLAQVVADNLGADFDTIRIVQGDTAAAPFGSGTGGSRTAAVYGAAAREASILLREKVLRVAAEVLECSVDDLELDHGIVSVKGDPDGSLSLAQLASIAYAGHRTLPADMEPGLAVSHRTRAPLHMFSNATHACIVEIDPVSGKVEILRYVVSEDCGNMINPMVVEGQIAGGVVQGIGGVFYENFVYDDDGNPLTTTFMDYLIPTAVEVPLIEYGHVVTPSNTSGGFKPMGEGGAINSPPTLINAVRDALVPFGATVVSQPLGPEQIVALMNQGARAGELHERRH